MGQSTLKRGIKMKITIAWVLVAVSGLFALTAAAAEVSLSGFGTLGYAQSNQPYNFQRFINSRGSIARDSVAGVQADVKLTDQFGATVQGEFDQSNKNDSVWDATLSWAFLAWRPSNDLLLRLGKQRSSLYLYSESMEVGVTHDFARLPIELYGTSPTSDYLGGSFSKTWTPGLGELTLDGYLGTAQSSWRFYQRDNVLVPGTGTIPGANYKSFTMDGSGMVLTLLSDEDRYRASAHFTTFTLDHGQTLPAYTTLIQPADIGLINSQLAAAAGLVSGSAYYVLPQAQTNKLTTQAFTLGAEILLPQDFRFIGEYARRKMTNTDLGLDSNGGYVSILKEVGAWTPYVSCALIKSKSSVTSLYQTINANPGMTALVPIPLLVDAVSQINASQRIVADALTVYDQNTIALGASYRLSPTQKLKFEWARTHVGVASSFVDAPSFGNVSNRNIDVLSFSYNVVF